MNAQGYVCVGGERKGESMGERKAEKEKGAE
jgi:hypothetical protein